eukprot:319443-Prymnesium_polylepis.1
MAATEEGRGAMEGAMAMALAVLGAMDKAMDAATEQATEQATVVVMEAATVEEMAMVAEEARGGR